MTAKELYRLKDLKKLISRNAVRLAELESRIDPASMNFTGMPHNTTTDNTTTTILNSIIDLKNEIEAQQREYLLEQIRLERFIHTIDDFQMRLIMSLRFIDMLTWGQIAQYIGGGNTEDGVRMACSRYLARTSA